MRGLDMLLPCKSSTAIRRLSLCCISIELHSHTAQQRRPYQSSPRWHDHLFLACALDFISRLQARMRGKSGDRGMQKQISAEKVEQRTDWTKKEEGEQGLQGGQRSNRSS